MAKRESYLRIEGSVITSNNLIKKVLKFLIITILKWKTVENLSVHIFVGARAILCKLNLKLKVSFANRSEVCTHNWPVLFKFYYHKFQNVKLGCLAGATTDK